MNIYVTSESSTKIQNLIMNIKNFFIFDVQEFINNFNLDVSKPANIYLINNEITNTILSASKLKKYQGIIYINNNLTENLYYSLKKKFGNDEHIDKWLTINCISKCKDFFRLPFFNKTITYDDIKDTYSFDCSYKIDVFNSIMSLPQKERIVIHLFYYEDMTINEIAYVLNTNPSTVKTRLRRAKIHLKEDLGDDWINE